jgi:mycofactocin system FadH/OYE family oxidoreductase 1
MRLLKPVTIAGRTARNRVMIGPIVTNLGTDERTFSARHEAFYARRAAGGCGTIVLEEAAVHDSDWAYERAPLASRCEESWRCLADGLHQHGALVLAGLGHHGGQGSSAYSQRELWAPSRVPEVNAREVPKWMEHEDIAAVIAGFADAAALAGRSGLDGVEINAGQHSLVRQFMSALTNHRDDEWGTDRLAFVRAVLDGVRSAIGTERILSLRLSADELAPWAGITPETGAQIAADLAPLVDMVVVVRGSIFSAQATRPDFHEAPGFNMELCRAVRAAVRADVGDATTVVLQGSVVNAAMAEAALDEGVCDMVEMTRAHLADANLVMTMSRGDVARPCIRCNQLCQVRDVRNPIISCVADPRTGHELEDPDADEPTPTARARRVLIVGGGPAGLEAARVAALRGHHVTLAERSAQLGGAAALAGPGAELVEWLATACRTLGVEVELNTDICDPHQHHSHPEDVIVCTGSRAGERTYRTTRAAVVLDVVDPSVLDGSLPRPVAIWDPIGGPIAVALAERLGADATLITPDQIAGNELSRSGDLAPANTRLARQAITVERRAVVTAVRKGRVELQDRFSGQSRTIAAACLVDAGFRLPNNTVTGGDAHPHRSAGDCVAPRTIAEAVLEGRRGALSV